MYELYCFQTHNYTYIDTWHYYIAFEILTSLVIFFFSPLYMHQLLIKDNNNCENFIYFLTLQSQNNHSNRFNEF